MKENAWIPSRDLLVKAETGLDGILPRFNRVILDEGHHIEDAATSLFRQQLSSQSIKRSIRPLIQTKKVAGALERLGAREVQHLRLAHQRHGRVGEANAQLFEDMGRRADDAEEKQRSQQRGHRRRETSTHRSRRSETGAELAGDNGWYALRVPRDEDFYECYKGERIFFRDTR